MGCVIGSAVNEGPPNSNQNKKSKLKKKYMP